MKTQNKRIRAHSHSYTCTHAHAHSSTHTHAHLQTHSLITKDASTSHKIIGGCQFHHTYPMIRTTNNTGESTMDASMTIFAKTVHIPIVQPPQAYRIGHIIRINPTNFGLLSAVLPTSTQTGVNITTVIPPTLPNSTKRESVIFPVTSTFGHSYTHCTAEVGSWLNTATAADELKLKIHQISQKSKATSCLLRTRVSRLEKENQYLQASTHVVRKRLRVDHRCHE